MKADLERCVEAWQGDDTPVERLGGAARASVIRRALDPQTEDKFVVALFFPLRRWVIASAAPVALALGIAGLATYQGTGYDRAPGIAAIEVAKIGDRVVLSVRNGHENHRVVKATDPRGLDASRGVAIRGGVYEESLDATAPGDGSLVFYRIE